MNAPLRRSITAKNYLAGGSIVAGLMAASSASAHAELIVQTPYQNFDGTTSYNFNLSDNPVSFSTSDTSMQFFGDGKSIAPNSATSAGITSIPVLPGDVINGSSTFTNSGTVKVGKNSTSYFGAHVGNNYGYFNFTAAKVDGTFTFTLNEMAYETTADTDVIIPGGPVPEASNFGLMAVATMGAAGLIAYRRRRQSAVLEN